MTFTSTALPEKVGGEGVRAYMSEMGSGRQVLHQQERTGAGAVCKVQNWQRDNRSPVHWLQFSLGSGSRGHVLGVGGRLGGSEA